MEDYRLHANVRVLLIREWVDLSHLEYGVANGVVYITGTLRHHLAVKNGNGKNDAVMLVRDLETNMQKLPGVQAVVFQLSNLTKVGQDWELRA